MPQGVGVQIPERPIEWIESHRIAKTFFTVDFADERSFQIRLILIFFAIFFGRCVFLNLPTSENTVDLFLVRGALKCRVAVLREYMG